MPKSDRSPESVERVFEAIRRVHAKYPDLRVGQILYNAFYPDDGFNIENDAVVRCLDDSIT